MLDKEDNIMGYVCLFPNRSYMVIDPLTCDACFHPISAKTSIPSRDTLVHPNTLKPVLPLESTIPTYGLSKILQVSCHRCKQ